MALSRAHFPSFFARPISPKRSIPGRSPQKFNTDHHEIDVSQSDVLAAIPDALRAMDLPTMDGINTYFVSRETRKAGCQGRLVGTGRRRSLRGILDISHCPADGAFCAPLEATARNAPHSTSCSAFSAFAPENDQNRKLASLVRDNGRVLHPYFLARMLFTPGQRDKFLQRTQSSDLLKRRRLRSVIVSADPWL